MQREVQVGEVGYLASQPWPFPSSLMFGCAGEAETDEIEVDPAELDDAIWVSLEEAMAAMAGLRSSIRDGPMGPSPSAANALAPCSLATALRSAPAQNVPLAP